MTVISLLGWGSSDLIPEPAGCCCGSQPLAQSRIIFLVRARKVQATHSRCNTPVTASVRMQQCCRPDQWLTVSTWRVHMLKAALHKVVLFQICCSLKLSQAFVASGRHGKVSGSSRGANLATFLADFVQYLVCPVLWMLQEAKTGSCEQERITECLLSPLILELINQMTNSQPFKSGKKRSRKRL